MLCGFLTGFIHRWQWPDRLAALGCPSAAEFDALARRSAARLAARREACGALALLGASAGDCGGEAAVDARSAGKGVDLRRGLFAEALALWRAVWPRAQLLVLRVEDYARDPRAFLLRVFRHLGLDDDEGAAVEEGRWQTMLSEDRSAFFPALLPLPELPTGVGSFYSRPTDKEPMLPRTRRFLVHLFRPFNERLAEMLDDEGFLWKDQ